MSGTAPPARHTQYGPPLVARRVAEEAPVGVVRTVVFPALRLAVWSVIALALCVLAFGQQGSGAGASGDPLQPTADLSQQTVAVSVGRVESTVTLTGTVSADPAAVVRSTATGTVRRLRARVGDRVEATTALLDLTVPTTPPVSAAPDAPPPAPTTRTVTIRAGSAGTLASLAVLVDQEVAVGSDLATVSPGTLSVSAPLTQAQQFRLLRPPGSAEAQAPGGPAPFPCTDLRTEAAPVGAEPAAPAVPDPYSGMVPQTTTAQLWCRVPPGTTVFPGMSATLTVRTGEADGALLVPVTAVQGTVESGTVWLPGPDGTPQERPVRLGITDGTQVQVLEGLAEGDEVLQFTPVPLDDPAGEGLPGELPGQVVAG